MAKKNRPSVQKRQREQKKRQREMRKAEKAAEKQQRREDGEAVETTLVINADGTVSEVAVPVDGPAPAPAPE